MDVAPGTVVLFSDIGCPWASAAVERFHVARERAGLDSPTLDHRAFALEVVNRRPTPKPALDIEVRVVGALVPQAGWRTWEGPASAWPVTTLPAMEAVRAAREQGPAAAEVLDRALRRAFFAESRCISMRHVILDVAASCGVDAGALAVALDDGRCRRTLMDEVETGGGDEVRGSPHFFLPDGDDLHNPGVTMHWEGEEGEGELVIDADDPSVYDEIIRRASA